MALKGAPLDKLIYRPNDLIRLLGVPRSTLYRWVREGSFPKPIQLGGRATGWRYGDVQDWLDSREPVGV